MAQAHPRQHEVLRSAVTAAMLCILLFAAASSFSAARDDIASQLLNVPLGLELSRAHLAPLHAGFDGESDEQRPAGSGPLLLLTDPLSMDLRLYRGGVPVAVYPLSAKARQNLIRSNDVWERELELDAADVQPVAAAEQLFTLASQSSASLELITDQTIAETSGLDLLHDESLVPRIDLRLYRVFDLVSFDNDLQYSPQTAMDDDDQIYIAALDDPGMGDLRGGFSIGGVEFNFGASVTSIINDVRLESVFTISQTGLVMNSQTLYSASGAGGASADVFKDIPVQVSLGNMRATGGSVAGTATLVGGENGANLADVIPGNAAERPGLQNFQGVVVNNADGSFSAALHDVSKTAVMGAVVSNASDQNLQQHIDVRVDVGNIGQAATQSFRSHIMNSTQSAIYR